MKINGNAIKPGNVIEHEKSLWVAVKTAHVKPGKGGAFAQVELKNLIDGRKLNERFRSSDTVERVRLEQKDYQFLYAQGDMLVFMDTTTYDQIELHKDFVGDERVQFLQDGMEVTLEFHEERPIGIELPDTVVLEIVDKFLMLLVAPCRRQGLQLAAERRHPLFQFLVELLEIVGKSPQFRRIDDSL